MIPRLVCILSNNPSPFFFFPHKIELRRQLHKECERVKVRLKENIARFATRAWKRGKRDEIRTSRGENRAIRSEVRNRGKRMMEWAREWEGKQYMVG